MTVINTGDATEAPYRRLAVLRNIAGIAYESPTKKTIQTTLGEITGDTVNLNQIKNILTTLSRQRLAKFTLPDIDGLGYNAYRATVIIRDLDSKILIRLTNQADNLVNGKQAAMDKIIVRPKPRAKPKPNTMTAPVKRVTFTSSRRISFSKKHPNLNQIVIAVVAGLIILAIPTFTPKIRNYMVHHIFHTISSHL